MIGQKATQLDAGLQTTHTERVIANIEMPSFVFGQTLAGNWGCWDSMIGIRPLHVEFNGGTIPTLHTQIFGQTYAYTAPFEYGPLRARLFAGLEACATDKAINQEWGIRIMPGSSLRALFGMQAVVSVFRFGLAYGGVARRKTSHDINNKQVYDNRSQQYLQMHNQDRNALIPFQLDGGLHAGVLTGYFGGVWKRYSFGLAFQAELSQNTHQQLSRSVRFAIGYNF